MFKRLRWPQIVITLSFIVIILFGASYFIVQQSLAVMGGKNSNNDNGTSNVEKPIKNTEETTLSEYPGLQLRIETEEASKYTTSIITAVTDSKELNEPIEKWINEQRNEFFELIDEDNNAIDENNRAHLNIQLETEKVTDTIYSLVFKSYLYTGGANGMTAIKTATIDVENNRFINLDDVFEINEDSLKLIKEKVSENINNDEEVELYINEEFLAEKLSDESEWEWSLSSTEFMLHFAKFEVAAGAAGNVHGYVQIEDLRPYVKDEILKELNIPQLPPKDDVDKSKVNYVRDLDPDGKYVVLTFDDGPSGKVTPRVLDTLKKYDARATFFMLGSQVDYYPELVKQIAQEGHEVANHSQSHADLTKLPTNKIVDEIAGTNAKIKALIGKEPTLFRPPYGAINDNVRNVSKENNMVISLWSIDTLDWQNRNPVTINQIVNRDLANGSVILMHDIHATTADALPKMLEKLQKDGYEFITMSELLSLDNDYVNNAHFFIK